MQLNSLTLNSVTTSDLCDVKLTIYDHKLTKINDEIFIFGKNINNLSIQTPLNKLNVNSLRVEHIYTQICPFFRHVIIFSYNETLYFWGKTQKQNLPLKNQLYEFDGLKFTQLKQFGNIPDLDQGYSHCIFSHHFLLIFGGFKQNQTLNQWKLLNLQTKTWLQIKSNIQMPFCYKSSLLWINGRGYIILASAFKQKKLVKNMLYEIKLNNLKSLQILCEEISLSTEIQSSNFLFDQLLSFDSNSLIIMSDELFCNKDKELSSIIDKKLYKLDLQTYEWITYPLIIQTKLLHNSSIILNNKLYLFGHILDSQYLEIEVFDFSNYINSNKFQYQQSSCYICSQAFTYLQKYTHQPIVQSEYDNFLPKSKIQNKFIKKYSRSITNSFQSIGIICDFFTFLKGSHIQLTLLEQLDQYNDFFVLKSRIQNKVTQVFSFKANTKVFIRQKLWKQCFNNILNEFQSDITQNLCNELFRLKLACFQLGLGFIHITITSERSILITYCSYSQTDFPEPNYRSHSTISYSISYYKYNKQLLYSSEINRSIIFQNLKMYFGYPESYENLQFLINLTQSHSNFVQIYVFGVQNMQKIMKVLPTKCYQDLIIQGLNKNNQSNSLVNYLRHFYLTENLDIKFENSQIESLSIYKVCNDYQKNQFIRQIPIGDDYLNKNKSETQQTHFSTHHDELGPHKKINMIQKCQLFEIQNSQKINSLYKRVFIYYNKRLLKTLSTKKNVLCGAIQIKPDIELLITNLGFANRQQQRKIQNWLNQIENSILENPYSQNHLEP